MPAGSHDLNPETVAEDQRARIKSALTEFVAERGLLASTVSEITRRARVSPRTFYEHYADKETCFLVVYDEIAGRVMSLISDAYDAPSAPSPVRAAIGAFLQFASAEPDAALLFLLGTLGGGPSGLEERLRSLLDQVRNLSSKAIVGTAEPPADVTIMTVLGGIRGVVLARARVDEADELPELADDLTQWALSYPRVPPPFISDDRQRQLRSQPHADPTRERDSPLAPLASGRHDLPPHVVADSQRERIIDAFAAILAEKGHAGVTVAEIANRARVSHRTFYEHFSGKREVFTVAMRVGEERDLKVAVNAYLAHATDWRLAVTEAIKAVLDQAASEPVRARLPFIDAFGARPRGHTPRESTLRAFIGALDPGSKPNRHPVPPIAAEAITGAIWELVRDHIARAPTEELPSLAPQLIYVTLTPYLGSARAASIAQRACA